MITFSQEEIKNIVSKTLEEDLYDLNNGDITTNAIVKEDTRGHGIIKAKDSGIIAGINFAEAAFKILDNSAEIIRYIKDGDHIIPGDRIIEIKANLRSILSAERIALNFLQRMSGIATTANNFSRFTNGKVKILDTRKTTPGLRKIEKYSVFKGGGFNHRFGLYDMFLIKDNHIAACNGDIKKAVKKVIKKNINNMKIEVEITSLEQIPEISELKVDRIMLDNMSIINIKKAIKLINNKTEIEISGGITIDRIKELSKLEIDYISVGSLTHSYKSLDISLDIV